MKERFFYYKNELIEELRSRENYPLSQINAALSQLVDDKYEFILDKFGRSGNLINIDDLYIFQPHELKDKNISIHDRNRPIESKAQKMKFKLNYEKDEIKESILKPAIVLKTKKEDGLLIIKTIKEQMEKVEETTIALRGENDWLKFAGAIRSEIESFGFKNEIIMESILDHIIEELSFNDQIKLLNYLTFNKLDKFEEEIYAYFQSKIMRHLKSEGILLYNKKNELFRLKINKILKIK